MTLDRSVVNCYRMQESVESHVAEGETHREGEIEGGGGEERGRQREGEERGR